MATCSFCGKRREEVQHLIAGCGVWICDECVKLCNVIIAEEKGQRPQAAGARSTVRAKRNEPWWKRLFPFGLGLFRFAVRPGS